MRRVVLLAAFLSMFVHVGVAYASGPVGSVPPPQYPNWGCTGTCNSANGDWSLTAGSSMVTNVASLYSNENVVIDVNDLVVPSNACIDITVDTLHICTSSNGLYPWTFSNVSGSYHQIQIFCSTSCQGNYLVSVLPISAPSPTPTPNPSFTATPTPLVPPTVTPPVVPRITHTPSPSPTPCVIDAWGCDQPATATYVACESGVVVNFGGDPCVTPSPTVTPTVTPTSTPAGAGRDCGIGVIFINCNMYGGAVNTNAYGWHGMANGNYFGNQLGCKIYNTDDFWCLHGNAYQYFTAPANGKVCVNWAESGSNGGHGTMYLGGNAGEYAKLDGSNCGSVQGGVQYYIQFVASCCDDGWFGHLTSVVFTPHSNRDCGIGFSVPNCDMWGAEDNGTAPGWDTPDGPTAFNNTSPCAGTTFGIFCAQAAGSGTLYTFRTLHMPGPGTVCVSFTNISGPIVISMNGTSFLNNGDCQTSAGPTMQFGVGVGANLGASVTLTSFTYTASGPTYTPTNTPTGGPTATGTATPAPTWTPRPTFTRTPVPQATATPVGFVPPTATILANIDTCLGTIQDCNLALTPIAGKIGGIPGLIATPMAPLNTSVFSPFQTIGITRGGCLSFGKLPVMIPHIIWLASPVPVRGGPTATPNISGYVPISVTWTLPTVVGTPMRQGNFGPIDPLEFEPCNDPAIPTWGWDLSWNASTFFEWLGFFVWTIALIRRIFG